MDKLISWKSSLKTKQKLRRQNAVTTVLVATKSSFIIISHFLSSAGHRYPSGFLLFLLFFFLFSVHLVGVRIRFVHRLSLVRASCPAHPYLHFVISSIISAIFVLFLNIMYSILSLLVISSINLSIAFCVRYVTSIQELLTQKAQSIQ